MIRTVVITRPAAQAQALAQRITALGRRVVVFPLLDIQPLDASADAAFREELGRLGEYAMVAFVSPNAIDAAFARIQSWPAPVTIAIIGEGSRQALARHGVNETNARIVSPHRTDRTDSQSLLEALDPASLRNRRVLIVRAETGRELLADAMTSAGAQVTQIAGYRRLAPELTPDRSLQLQALLAAQHDWIITSSEALRILIDLVGRVDPDKGVSNIQRHVLIVPHGRIKEYAEALGFQHVQLTGSGDDSLIAALQSAS